MKAIISGKGTPKITCGFCKNKFRSRRQRTQHANRCKENPKA